MRNPGAITEVEGSRLLVACILACVECQRVLRGFTRDAAQAGPDGAAGRALVPLMLDCADACRATVAHSRGDSVFLDSIVLACTRICDECAAACERLQPDAAIDACAEACRSCARACFALSLEFLRKQRPAVRRRA